MTEPAFLGGVSEEAATGTVAAAYSEIRRILGVPVVMLVYRVLAAEPGRLERVWEAISRNLAAGETQRSAARLDPPESCSARALPRASVARAGLERVQLAATLDAFDRSNRLNLIGLTALLDGAPGNPVSDRTPAPLAKPREMLPMADLASLPPATLDLLREMSAPIVGDQQPILIPSLFRYFAHDEKLLRAIAQVLGPVATGDEFRRAVAAVAEHAREITALLPYPVERIDDDGSREIAARFVSALPPMIVTTSLLRAILGEFLTGDPAERPRREDGTAKRG